MESQFHEFYWDVSTEPDPEDLVDNPNMPGLQFQVDLEVERDDSDDSDDSKSDSNHDDMPVDHDKDIDPDSETTWPGKENKDPTQIQAEAALQDLQNLLHPPRKIGPGHLDPEINIFFLNRTRLEGMNMMLNFHVNKQSHTYDHWTTSSCQAAVSLSRGLNCARQLHKLTKQYIKDRAVLPLNPYGSWNEMMLVNEDLTNEIKIYLLSIGNDISGEKLRDFINTDDIQSQHVIDHKITIRTAQRYLNAL
jgi:hypothetical protein